MESKTQKASEIIPQTLAMLASSKGRQTTPLRLSEKQQAWMDKWFCLKTDHSQRLKHLVCEAYRFCADYANNPAVGYRMLIYGENGSGKSHIAKAIFRWASRLSLELPLQDAPVGVRLPEVMMVNWPQFVDSLKQGEWDRVDELMRTELLVLDDIGAEHDPSKVGQEKLYLLLERRENRWTIITTNIYPGEWQNRFERRIASRFLRNFVHVSLEDVPDFNSL